jgi:nitroreductase
MNRRKFVKAVPALAAIAGTAASAAPENHSNPGPQIIVLPQPESDGGKSLMQSLQERRTIREMKPTDLPLQAISNLLWAAFGMNRNKASFGKPGRTAPSASNSQEIDLYVALSAGVYMYDPLQHRLIPVAEGDFRSRSGRRVGAMAPLHIFYIADTGKYDLGPDQPDPHIGEKEVQKSYYYTDTGFIAQNVYLYAASAGLAAWFHNCDKVNTVKEFNLKPDQKVLFAQSVGYPA